MSAPGSQSSPAEVKDDKGRTFEVVDEHFSDDLRNLVREEKKIELPERDIMDSDNIRGVVKHEIKLHDHLSISELVNNLRTAESDEKILIEVALFEFDSIKKASIAARISGFLDIVNLFSGGAILDVKNALEALLNIAQDAARLEALLSSKLAHYYAFDLVLRNGPKYVFIVFKMNAGEKAFSLSIPFVKAGAGKANYAHMLYKFIMFEDVLIPMLEASAFRRAQRNAATRAATAASAAATGVARVSLNESTALREGSGESEGGSSKGASDEINK